MQNNRRKYVRISTVLPVEFCILDENGKKITPWFQGFTHDIGKGGICLIINDLWWGFWDKLKLKNTKILLRINLFFNKKSIVATAMIAWTNQEELKDFSRFSIGLEILDKNKKEIGDLFKYALFNKYTPRVITAAIALLVIFSVSLFFRTAILTVENRNLVKKYVDIIERSSNLREALSEHSKKDLSFKEKEERLNKEIVVLEEETKKYEQNTDKEISKEKIFSLEQELSALKRESEFLKARQKEYQEASVDIEKEFKGLQKEQEQISKPVIEGIYSWIKNRQDMLSGLVLSYEGDQNLKKMGFTYDQALAAITFVIFKDNQRAEKILDFYLSRVNKGENIYNAYYTGGECAEYVIHSGPNAWLGLAVLDYYKETKNPKYLPVAQKVADFLLSMMDCEGGIKGGPTVEWYATEHNLDAFAFFDSFYKITKDQKYLEARDKVKKWIENYAYTSYGPPVIRGKGDATIATDTYAWSVTAFGPEELFSMKMNPDSILEFAIENCEVQVKFKRKEGEVFVKGFDFAKFKNIPRGGVISCEWTAQMILSFEIMADFYKTKDPVKYKSYLKQAIYYFAELQKMLITSASKIGREDPCFPYASSSSVDTGHGWRTPEGDKTGSLSSTAYFLIAYKGYNPLKGEYLSLSLKEVYEKTADKFAAKSN
ncbi:MAG: PilZ domain-containing protein [Candidatus Omnitrophota bacterium]